MYCISSDIFIKQLHIKPFNKWLIFVFMINAFESKLIFPFKFRYKNVTAHFNLPTLFTLPTNRRLKPAKSLFY